MGARARGFTLVEVLVVVTLSSVLVIAAMRGWRPIQQNTLHLRDRARIAAELRLATDWLLADLGAAETVTEPFDDELHIARSRARAILLGTWNGLWDPGVTYVLSGDDLIRTDDDSGAQLIVASNVTLFEIDDPGDGLHVALEAGGGLELRRIELVWDL